MKKAFIIMLGMAMAGCATAPSGPPLNADQARDQAVQLANDKAASFYHCRPFTNATPASFQKGHWFWTQLSGQGHGDMQAKVELRADGQPIIVDVQQTTGILAPNHGF